MTAKINEELLVKRFSRDLEMLEKIDEIKIAQVSDDEYRGILHLAKKLTKIDFSGESKARAEINNKFNSTIEINKGLSRNG